MIQPAMKPYGFAVTFVCNLPSTTLLATATEERTIRRKGTEVAARRAATMTPGFVQVVTCTPIAQEEAPPPRPRNTPSSVLTPIAPASLRVPSTPDELDEVVDAVRAIKAAAAELAGIAQQRRALVETIAEKVAIIERLAPTPPGVDRVLHPSALRQRCQRLHELFNMEELSSWKITVDRSMDSLWQRLPH